MVTSAVHYRMPVILDSDSYDLWLDLGFSDVRAASELLKPFDALRMRCFTVSARINHVANDNRAADQATPVKQMVKPEQVSNTKSGI
jgi:putative SOS response-associated peptidase YedK